MLKRIEFYYILIPMIALKTGTYLGNIEKALGNNHIFASVTSYPDRAISEKRHRHENPHLSFVLRGGNLEKRQNKDIERAAGKITFYYSGEFHQSTNITAGSRHLNLEISSVLLNEYALDEGTLESTINKNPDAKFLLLKVYKELLVCDETSLISIRMLLFDLLSRCRHFQNRSQNPPWIAKAEEILRSNWREHISLNDLSAELNMHPVTVSKQFHKYYLCTFGEYVRKLKIEKALTLIKNSQLSLTEISYECGFFDQSHFTKTFKQLTGLLPRFYQKK